MKSGVMLLNFKGVLQGEVLGPPNFSHKLNIWGGGIGKLKFVILENTQFVCIK